MLFCCRTDNYKSVCRPVQVLQPISSTQVFLVALYLQSTTEMVLKFYVAAAWFLYGCPELKLLELTSSPPTPSMEAKNISSYLSHVRSNTEGEIQLSSSVFQMGYRIYEPSSPFITYTNQVSFSFYLISSVRSVN